MRKTAKMIYVVDTVKKITNRQNAKNLKMAIPNGMTVSTVKERTNHQQVTQVYGTSVHPSSINRKKSRSQYRTTIKKTIEWRFVTIQSAMLERLVGNERRKTKKFATIY